MLEITGDNNETQSPVTSRIREVLARNIAARNHGLSPQRFNGAVITLHSALVAAKLLEDAGFLPRGSLEQQTREKGLAEGLLSLFGENDPCISEGPDGKKVCAWPDLSCCKDLSVDPHVTSMLVRFTLEKKFCGEWADAWSDSHERSVLAYLQYKARFSNDGRMVIAEQYPLHPGPGETVLPAGLLHHVASDLILPVLAGKTPKNSGMRLLDPACRSGRILLAMFRVLTCWHLSWYNEHLVPLLEEGRDPASRKVQGLLPAVVSVNNHSGYQRFGPIQLPVYKLPDGRWDLTWDETVRILGESVHGIDSDPAAIEVTRLSLLLYLLNNTRSDCPDRAGSGMLRVVLSRNIRQGYILIGKDYEERPSLLSGAGMNRPFRGFEFGDEFPAVASSGGFAVVFGMFPSRLPYSGTETKDYLCRHYHSGKPDDAVPFYIESGLSLTRPGGILCGFVTGGWQRSRDAGLFRSWLAGYQLESVVSLGSLPPFTGMRDPLLITISNNSPEHPVRVIDATAPAEDGEWCSSFRTTSTIDPKNLGRSPWILKGVPPAEIRKKIDSAGTPLARYILGEYMLVENESYEGYTISRREYETILLKDPVAGSFIHPFILEGEVRRYTPSRHSLYCVRIPPGKTRALAGDVPDLWKWFFHHHHTLAKILTKNNSKQRKTGKNNSCWWEWQGPATRPFMERPVLLTRAEGETGGPEWMIVSREVCPGPGVLAIPCHEPALPGILNSRLALFYILSSARKKGTHGYNFSHLMKFPVTIPETEEDSGNGIFGKIAGLVGKRYALGNAADAAVSKEESGSIGERVQRCEGEIDALVYELYGLSAGETCRIENWLSRECGLPATIKSS